MYHLRAEVGRVCPVAGLLDGRVDGRGIEKMRAARPAGNGDNVRHEQAVVGRIGCDEVVARNAGKTSVSEKGRHPPSSTGKNAPRRTRTFNPLIKSQPEDPIHGPETADFGRRAAPAQRGDAKDPILVELIAAWPDLP